MDLSQILWIQSLDSTRMPDLAVKLETLDLTQT